jgi:hypothetical protein
VAFYPTNVPLHRRSAWLNGRDPFGDLVGGCRKLGMKIIARIDPHAAGEDVLKSHPDWLAADEKGDKRPHGSTPGLWLTCALGPYNFELMTQVLREIMSNYDVDAVFGNRWNGSGMCYCEHCRRNFQAFAGMDIPTGTPTYSLHGVHPKDTPWYRYSRWVNSRLLELWDLWERELRKLNPNSRFIPNMGGGEWMDMEEIGKRAVILTLDRQGRSGNTPPWAIGRSVKQFRAVNSDATLGASLSVGMEGGYRWKDSVQSGPEVMIWASNAVANGLNLSFTKFCTTLYDRRWLSVEEQQFQWHHRWEQYLRNERPLARTAMVYSGQTEMFDRHPDARGFSTGMYQALVEARIPFEFVNDRLLEEDHLAPFKLLVLPNIAALSDHQCEMLRAFVNRGGSLLATYETSLYDEWGRKRSDFGLADLFGVRYQGRTEGPMRNSYIRLERPHPVLAGFDGAERIVNSVGRVMVEASAPLAAGCPLTLIPSYPDLPMEQLFPRVPKTDIPMGYFRQHGEGRVVYLPGDLDRSFWEFLLEDHARLLKNCFLWAANEDPPVTVTGPGLLDVTYWKQRDSVTVHLLNLSNPMTMRGYYREFLPVGAQQVRIRLPRGARAKQVRLLSDGSTTQFSAVAGVLSLTVPRVVAHEVIAVDLT